jgi:hypothetical protein
MVIANLKGVMTRRKPVLEYTVVRIEEMKWGMHHTFAGR